ncbi:MAG: DUF3843 family protein [Muribaculaceae bacterium]|nr:DUF3843 family protein [Muribaculaceae bacterium]
MISKEQFLLRQPAAPEVTETDPYYLTLCNRLVDFARENNLFPSYPEKVVERCALTLIGYYQDVICDAGIWRSFITECRRLYNFTVPFYSQEDDYVDFELNEADVKFMVWYSLSMNYEPRRVCNPFDPELLEGAEKWYRELEKVYDESPLPVDYRLVHELEIHAEEDRPAIMKLANWLFLHCYLMTPAYALTLSEIASEYDLSSEDGILEMQKRLDISMWRDPTGPLALYLGEWLYLIIESKPAPEQQGGEEEKGPHKYYTSFTSYTQGKTMEFFSSYEDLNKFFIEALGWAQGEEHLPQIKGDSDFILMVDEQKGMLLARNIAKCIASPDNPLYDKEYAQNHAMDLLTERGCCPADLLKVICENGWLPDAHFPGSDDYNIVMKYWDFISRCYLQQYYRGD